jgi:hypothetical protein
MYRITRNLVAAAAATVLLAGVAPTAAVAAETVAKPGASEVHAKPKPTKPGKDKPKPGKDKGDKGNKGSKGSKGNKGKKDKEAKKLVGERNAALQIVRTRDAQLAKVAKYVTSETPLTVGGVAAKDVLLANLAADKASLAATAAAVAKATTVAQVKTLKAGAQAYTAANYEDAADLLYWAADNFEYANEEPTAVGAPEAAAKALEAAALLVQVHAVDSDDVLDAAEALLDESDTFLYGADDSDDDEDDEFEDDEFEDDFRA